MEEASQQAKQMNINGHFSWRRTSRTVRVIRKSNGHAIRKIKSVQKHMEITLRDMRNECVEVGFDGFLTCPRMKNKRG